MQRRWAAVVASVLLAGVLVGPRPAAAGTGYTECYDDGQSGTRVQLLYAYDARGPSQFPDEREDMHRAAAAMESIVVASAAQTGGERHLRFVSGTDCDVSVAVVPVTSTNLPQGLNGVQALDTELEALGYNRTDRVYLVWLEQYAQPANTCAGIADINQDERPGAVNDNNTGPRFGYAEDKCLDIDQHLGQVELHEVVHTLGAVHANAPHRVPGSHTDDDVDDIMWDSQTNAQVDDCNTPTLDCGHDDYFSTDPVPSSYLATHWNVADSPFLDDSPGVTPDPPDPPTLSPPVPGDARLQLHWTPPAPAPRAPITEYHIYRDGTLVHTTGSGSNLSYTDTGLTNETTYAYEVTAENAGGESARSTPQSGTPHHFQPDLHLRRVGQAAYSGDDVYNTTGAGQSRSTRTPRGSTAAFDLRIQSDASGADVVRVSGPHSVGGFRIQYVKGTIDITRDVTGRHGHHYDVPLAAGASRTIRVRITPTTAVRRFVGLAVLVTAQSRSDAPRKDVVKMAVTAT